MKLMFTLLLLLGLGLALVGAAEGEAEAKPAGSAKSANSMDRTAPEKESPAVEDALKIVGNDDDESEEGSGDYFDDDDDEEEYDYDDYSGDYDDEEDETLEKEDSSETKLIPDETVAKKVDADVEKKAEKVESDFHFDENKKVDDTATAEDDDELYEYNSEFYEEDYNDEDDDDDWDYSDDDDDDDYDDDDYYDDDAEQDDDDYADEVEEEDWMQTDVVRQEYVPESAKNNDNDNVDAAATPNTLIRLSYLYIMLASALVSFAMALTLFYFCQRSADARRRKLVPFVVSDPRSYAGAGGRSKAGGGRGHPGGPIVRNYQRVPTATKEFLQAPPTPTKMAPPHTTLDMDKPLLA